MHNIGDVIEEQATVEWLLRDSKSSDIVMASSSLECIGRVLPCLKSRGDIPCLLFVEGVWRQEALPEDAESFWRKTSHQRVCGVTTQVSLFGFRRL
jgi:hypothetical protein